MSSVGKGVAAASIGKILQAHGYPLSALKADPYINVDAGTMNPTEHGEVFVTDDGDETDQDIGNYERFLDHDFHSVNYMTTGRVYQTVIQHERNLDYKGKCVEVVPHIPEEIIGRIVRAAEHDRADITLIEIGGTVGEYQNILFLEAARMMKMRWPNDVAVVLVSYLPIPGKVGEMKTKPTQYASRSLNSVGIQADFIVARSERMIDEVRRSKLAVFCGIPEDAVIPAPDVDSIYQVPLNFIHDKFDLKLLKRLDLRPKAEAAFKDLGDWKRLVRRITQAKQEVRIAIVGKYFSVGEFVLADSYISVIEALKHAIWFHGKKPVLVWLDAEKYEKDPKAVKELLKYDGVLIPGGFGARGVEGKIKAIEYARIHHIPYFGLCYGMQLAVIEIARHVAKLKAAHTYEVNKDTPHPVIDVNPEQKKLIESRRYGGTMRLGSYACRLTSGTKARAAYKQPLVSERHRHRYELNNEYKTQLEKVGLVFSGINPESDLVEIIELAKHPWFVGVQFHPEFKSRPLRPHPLFREFIAASIKHKRSR